MTLNTTLTTLDGFALAVQQDGPDDGPTLLLLPGQANSHRWWNGLRERFHDRFRTVTFDYRGTGESRGEIGPWTTRSFADDARAVLDHVGADQAVVYGTSMGGRIAQFLAAREPARVSALLLACTTPGGEHAVERSNELRARLGRADAATRLQMLFELFYTPAWGGTPESSTLLGDASMTGPERAAHLKVSDLHDAWEVLPEITAPTLVLHGTDDEMAPVVNAERIAGRIPGAQLRLWAGTRHGFFSERADEVTAEILRFLDAEHS
ncbi:alpha/beta fold hydrolase [Citricoccus muralis]|uniref:Alpha/beta fold hydrolase n=1 Tax=Citricoccus muralis TaxID=169134 RepID=A0ABY8H9P1_9MICC|nr:alpha/beta fold hydrolase [Citricoccus muralis]WFP17425.1 alpha/beta fold hydrolase [Citricoccus muralis]